jgi:hypothetical protein
MTGRRDLFRLVVLRRLSHAVKASAGGRTKERGR